jgi:hypothetical protein
MLTVYNQIYEAVLSMNSIALRVKPFAMPLLYAPRSTFLTFTLYTCDFIRNTWLVFVPFELHNERNCIKNDYSSLSKGRFFTMRTSNEKLDCNYFYATVHSNIYLDANNTTSQFINH